MSVCFGAGILGLLPADIEDTDFKFQFMKDFAAKGLSHGFREVIGNGVAEFKYRKGAVESRWLDKDEAAPVIAAEKSIGGSAPWSTIPDCLEGSLLLPGYRGGGAHQVVLPLPDESEFDWHAAALRDHIEYLGDYQADESEDVDGHVAEWLLKDMRLCREHRLIWCIGE